MTVWTEGYVADLPYSIGFYRETVPAHLAFAAVVVGKDPGSLLQPKRVLELGIGMGFSFVITAASNPSVHFEGVDFNPVHVAHAQSLIDEARIPNANVRESSFQDFAQDICTETQDMDLIVLHGILSWVSEDAHEAIIDIARKRLKPGGFLYVSYNCMPGWAPVLPLQRLMLENAKRNDRRSDHQVEAGLNLAQGLLDEGALYFTAYPSIKPRLDRLLKQDKSYLAHELLNANWHIFHFSDVSALMSRAKLGFVCSATVVENMDGLAVPKGSVARIVSETDIVFKEMLRDYAINKQFRRDIYCRGVSALTRAEQNQLLSVMHFMLVLPSANLSRKQNTPIGELDINENLYDAIVGLLSKGPATFSAICNLPQLERETSVVTAMQAISLMIHNGQVVPLPAKTANDVSAAKRLNAVICKKVNQGRSYGFLSAPVAGGGTQATNIDLLMLHEIIANDESNADILATSLLASMSRLDINWVEDGDKIVDAERRNKRARDAADVFLNEKVPLWRRLGVF